MNGREKTLMALSYEGSPEIAASICYDSIYTRDVWEQLTPLPWWYGVSNDLELMKAAYRDIYRSLDYDWISARVDVDDLGDEGQYRIFEQEGRVFRVSNASGEKTELYRQPLGGDVQEVLDAKSGAPNNIDELEEFINDFAEKRGLNKRTNGALPAYLREQFPGRCPMGYANSPFELCFLIWGFDRTLSMVYDNIDLFEKAAGMILDKVRAALQNEVARGAEVIWLEECYGDLISPEHYRRLCFPFVRALCEEIRILGMKSIYYFAGNPTGRFDMLLDSKADMLGFEESKKGIRLDIVELAEIVSGHCGLLGNLDAINLLPSCTTEELREALLWQKQAAKLMKGRFIFGLGSPLTPGTSLIRAIEYVELAHELGKL